VYIISTAFWLVGLHGDVGPPDRCLDGPHFSAD